MAAGNTETDGQGLHLVFIEKEIKLWRKVVLLAPDLRINPRSVFLGPAFQVSSPAWPVWGLGPSLCVPSAPARTGRRVMKSQVAVRAHSGPAPGCRLVEKKAGARGGRCPPAPRPLAALPLPEPGHTERRAGTGWAAQLPCPSPPVVGLPA